MEEEKKLENKPHTWAKTVTILGSLIIIFAGVILIIRECAYVPDKIATGTLEPARKAVNFLIDKFSTKEGFASEIISISSQKCQELTVVKSNATMIFRAVVWRGDYMGNTNEYFECVDDRAKFKEIKAVMGQICEVQAQGAYEFRYYVDMSDPNKWHSSFDESSRTIRIVAPPLQVTLPAEKTNIEIITIKDSVTINEGKTKEKLREQIPRLKRQTAERNIPNMLDTARISLQKFFKDWFLSKYRKEFEIVNPNIEVYFQGEEPIVLDRSKL